jgi:solute carrier family 35 (GDP-fucose transporter), member C1
MVGTVADQHLSETIISHRGLAFGVLSSVTTSIHAIIIKTSLQKVKGRTMELVYYNGMMSAILFTPVVMMSGEFATAYALVIHSNPQTEHLASFLTFGCLLTVCNLLVFSYND